MSGRPVELNVFTEEVSTEFNINAPYQLLNGCDTCPSIKIIWHQDGTLIDRKGIYQGGCWEITSFHYLCPASTEENEKQKAVKLFPNSSNNLLYIQTESKINFVSIYNEVGKIVFESDQVSN